MSLEIIMSKESSDLVRWEPDFSLEARAHLEQLRESVRPRVAVMRRLRLALNLTQKQVAQYLGVTQSNVSKLETIGDPSLSALVRMANAGGMKLRITLEGIDGEEKESFELSSVS